MITRSRARFTPIIHKTIIIAGRFLQFCIKELFYHLLGLSTGVLCEMMAAGGLDFAGTCYNHAYLIRLPSCLDPLRSDLVR
jgi:hypothetical protein